MNDTVPRRFGVLLNENRCAYSYAMADALDAAAAERDIELEYWPVGWAGSKEEAREGELDEVLEKGARVDGLVMIASVFSHGVKTLAKFVQAWWPRPASSIGYRLPLVPSVLVDNRGAMHAATRHLIQEHGRRQILFVRGRADSQEAADRYFGFRQALNENNIINDVGRVLEGDFTRQSAVVALHRLPTATAFDGLIASNDEMALAALGELELRGLRVPNEVSVIGFDDVPAAARSRTPLTTMRQPFDALATKALELVLQQCEGQDVPGTTDIPVPFMHRASCGCSGRR